MIDLDSGIVHPPADERIRKMHIEIKGKPVIAIASKDPVVIYPTTAVKQACRLMVDRGIRRLPVVDAGTRKLVGIISARDLTDLFGGGEKYNIVKNEFDGNLFAAVNMHVSKIMKGDVVSFMEDEPVGEAAKKMLEAGVGGCPVTNKNGKVVAIVSERDFIKSMADGKHGIRVRDIMGTNVLSVAPETSLKEAAKLMIRKGYRRLPVLRDGELVGILRTTSILKFVSGNDFSRFGTPDADRILSQETVEDAMSRYFVSVAPGDLMEDVIELILAQRMGGFPVEDNGKITGMVTEHDIFRVGYSGRVK